MAGKVSPSVKKLTGKEYFGKTNTLNLGNVFLGIGLASSVPAVNSAEYFAGFVEPSGSDGYSREPVGDYSQTALQYFDDGTTDANGDVTFKNTKEIKFDTYRGASAISVKYIVLFNASSGGNCLLYFELSSAITLNPGELLVIPVGQATLKIS